MPSTSGYVLLTPLLLLSVTLAVSHSQSPLPTSPAFFRAISSRAHDAVASASAFFPVIPLLLSPHSLIRSPKLSCLPHQLPQHPDLRQCLMALQPNDPTASVALNSWTVWSPSVLPAFFLPACCATYSLNQSVFLALFAPSCKPVPKAHWLPSLHPYSWWKGDTGQPCSCVSAAHPLALSGLFLLEWLLGTSNSVCLWMSSWLPFLYPTRATNLSRDNLILPRLVDEISVLRVAQASNLDIVWLTHIRSVSETDCYVPGASNISSINLLIGCLLSTLTS